MRIPFAFRPAVLALSVVLALSAPAAAQRDAQRGLPAALSLVVIDETTGQPVAGATVSVSGVEGSAATDARGNARLPAIAPGTRLVVVSRIGYGRAESLVEFGEGASLEAEVLLFPQAVELDGVRVTSWGRRTSLVRNGFYERQKTGQGTYLVREQIALMRPLFTADIFRRARGFSVVPKPKGGGYMVVSRRGAVQIGNSGFCYPLVFLDGMQMGEDALDFVHWEQVEAVETYAGPATIPPQYNATGTACGVILIWTR